MVTCLNKYYLYNENEECSAGLLGKELLINFHLLKISLLVKRIVQTDLRSEPVQLFYSTK